MKLHEIEELAKHVFAYTVPDTQVHEVAESTIKLCESIKWLDSFCKKEAIHLDVAFVLKENLGIQVE